MNERVTRTKGDCGRLRGARNQDEVENKNNGLEWAAMWEGDLKDRVLEKNVYILEIEWLRLFQEDEGLRLS